MTVYQLLSIMQVRSASQPTTGVALCGKTFGDSRYKAKVVLGRGFGIQGC